MVCDEVGEDLVDEYLSINSLDFFVYKQGKDIYIVQKKLPYPTEYYPPIIDVSLSKIYINIVIKVNSDELARQILMFIISDYGKFSKICYDAYKYDDVNSSIGYSFENQLVDDIFKYRIKNVKDNTEKKPLKLYKITRREALGRIAGFSLNEGITIASLSISENEYKERFECLPNYYIDSSIVSNRPISLNSKSLKEYLECFVNKKKIAKKIITKSGVIIICLILSLFTFVGLFFVIMVS